MRNREKNEGVGRWSISVIALALAVGEELLLGGMDVLRPRCCYQNI